MSDKLFQINPIGLVRSQNGSFTIEISETYRPALNELDTFGHIQVLWWCHFCDDKEYRNILECDKPYKKAPDKLGIFSTRSPMRPNPIGLSAVSVLSIEHEKGIIHIPYIDAEDGTPVLDLKPYHPSSDRIRDVRVPSWCSHWPEWMEDSASFNWDDEFLFEDSIK